MRAAEQSLQKANNGLHSAPLPQPRAQELLPGRAAPAQRAQSAAERAPRPRTVRPESLSSSFLSLFIFSLSLFFFPPFSLFLSVLFYFILFCVWFCCCYFLPLLPPPFICTPNTYLFIFLRFPPLPSFPPSIYLSERGAGENGAVISSRYKYRR